jgi:hypothetical protein
MFFESHRNNVDVELNEESCEYHCLLCSGNFVELQGQGIENFTSTAHTYGSGPEVDSDPPENEESEDRTPINSNPHEALQRLVARVLAQNLVTSTSGLGNAGPIAVVVRSNGQPTGNPSMGLGSTTGDLLSALLTRSLLPGLVPELMDPSGEGRAFDGNCMIGDTKSQNS